MVGPTFVAIKVGIRKLPLVCRAGTVKGVDKTVHEVQL